MRRFIRIMSSLMCVLMIAINISTPTYADSGVSDGGNSGGGSQGTGSGGQYSWDKTKSGYRLAIVDNNYNQVSNSVDLLFSVPSNGVSFGNDFYTNSRVVGMSTDKNNWDYIGLQDLKKKSSINTFPKMPIYYQSGSNIALGAGDDFKKWFLDNSDGLSDIQIPVTYADTPFSDMNGTTRPVSSRSGHGNGSSDGYSILDMNRTMDDYSAIISSSYRNEKLAEAVSYVIQQGYKRHAQAIIEADVGTANTLAFWLRKHDDNLSTSASYYEVLKDEWQYALSVGKTYAEAVYIYCSVVNRVAGSNWDYRPDGITDFGFNYNKTNDLAVNTSKIDTQTKKAKVASNNELTLEKIPTARGYNGNAEAILDAKKNGKFMFQFNQSAINNMIDKNGANSSRYPLDIMKENNYYVIVEPIFWFEPSAWPVGSNTLGHYFYGTESNLIQFYTNHGNAWGSTGGAYGVITSNLGWHSMYSTNNWKDKNGNVRFNAASATGGARDNNTLQAMLNNREAIAMHIYQTSPRAEDEQVTGEHDWTTAGAAPDPSQKKCTTGYSKEYNIVKYYEDTQNGVPQYYGPFTRSQNPPRIDINNEYYFSVADWFTTTTRIESNPSQKHYGDAKNAYSHVRTGNSEAKIFMNQGGEKTLVMLLKRNIGDGATNDGPLTLTQSQISKSISTADGSVPGWGGLNKTVTGNSATVNNNIEASSAGGNFGSRVSNNPGRYETTIWRGIDVPTIAAYNEGGGIELRNLLKKYGVTPVYDRGINGTYQTNFNANLTATDGSTTAYNGTVTINTYKGLNKKSIGNSTNSSQVNTTTPFGGSTSIHSAGYMIQQATSLDFYPYVWMTWMTTGSGNKNRTSVLSQYYSEMKPNNFAEAAWYNSNEDESLIMTSTQWSLNARAVNADDDHKWRGRNQVLPGGAIYQLSTGDDPTKVALVTWNTVLDDNQRNTLSNGISSNEYTMTEANAEHANYTKNAKAILEGLQVVQWANGNTNASSAWSNNGQSVKITGSGQSLSALGSSNVTSSESKYRLGLDSSADAANEGDLDVINSADSTDVFYKVFASPDGNIYLAKSIGNMGALDNINGNNPNSNGQVSVTQVLSKDGTVNGLTGEAKDINDRTMAITNLVQCLERNTGNDSSASWAPDGRWYNEAFNGYTIVRKCTTFSVGLNKPSIRSAAVDPRLCPSSSGQSDMYSKAVLSQFKLDNKSSNTPAGKSAGFIGSFEGKDITLPDMDSMYTSKKFYIPNVTVQDLH